MKTKHPRRPRVLVVPDPNDETGTTFLAYTASEPPITATGRTKMEALQNLTTKMLSEPVTREPANTL